MMRNYMMFLIAGIIAMSLNDIPKAHAEDAAAAKTAYDFAFETLDGKPLPLSEFKGKEIMVVNTASQCGFTPQYKGLQALYDKYKDKGLVIVGVPSNDFGEQEPGDNQEIKKFCQLNYGVTFPMASKQEVTGSNAHPFYKWAYEVLGFGTGPKWNFHKYLIDSNGKLVDYFNSTTEPDSEKLVSAVVKHLPKQ